VQREKAPAQGNPAHAAERDRRLEQRSYRKASFTREKNVRSPSLRVTSESSDAASCPKSSRCSGVSFFGVTTWTVRI